MHLHLLIHGLQGHPSHFTEAARLFRARHGTTVHLLVPSSFAYNYTYDGIDYIADRSLRELYETILALEKDASRRVTKLSVTGYSLGGLVARYVIGMLYSRGFFSSVAAVNFTSFTTPHVGIPPPPHTSGVLFWLGSNIVGRSGKQLHLLDHESNTGVPLLQVMAQPSSVFHCGLSQFRNINIYANAINDFTVPYFSGAFEETDPFAAHRERDMVPEYLPEYAPLIQGFSPTTSAPSFAARLKSMYPLTFNGPFIAWVFPWNLIIYLLLPLLVPLTILYIYLEYLVSSRASRARIRVMQHIAPLLPQPPPLDTNTDGGINAAPCTFDPSSAAAPSPLALMTVTQAAMVRALNTLPPGSVRKYIAFRPGVRNAHAMLICLQPRFADHRVGRGVLRHWADHFEV
ncbi:DUF676-domain-containing protein [Mycena crocata]|nr:DUF676-domain-containing protein [Mycena crocata]